MLNEEGVSVPAWITFSCRNGAETSRGEPIADAVAIANKYDNIIATGINCTAPKFISSLLKASRGVLRNPKRFIVYPNKGGIWDNDARSFVPDPEEGM
jgi:homocysteine S-methyltransferase